MYSSHYYALYIKKHIPYQTKHKTSAFKFACLHISVNNAVLTFFPFLAWPATS
ncbi:hypothetical protein Hanom_Chr02g00139421 [Helianthus anomalus]